MNKKFSSTFIEKEYLLLCSPSELLEYFDTISKNISTKENYFSRTRIDEDIEQALFDKNDKTTDFVLATICDSKLVEKILERNNDDSKILSAALSNKVAVNGIFSASSWLESRLDNIIEEGSDEQISNLFTNFSLPSKIIEETLLRTNKTKEIDDNRYYQILWQLLNNTAISKEPEDRYDYDLSQHKIIEACWNLLLILPVNIGTASLLQHAIPKFQEIDIPYSFKEKLNINDSTWSNKSQLEQQEFLKTVLNRWVRNDGEDESSYDYFVEVRKSIVKKINTFYIKKHKDFLLNRNDSFVTQAFFAALKSYNFSELNKETIENYYQKYGRDFLVGLIDGDQIFLKSNKKIGKIINQLVFSFKDDEVQDNYDTIQSMYRMKYNFLKNSLESERYINDEYDFDNEIDENENSIETIQNTIEKLREKISNEEISRTNILKEDIQLLSKQVELLNLKFDSISQNSDSIYNKLSSFSTSAVKNIDNIKDTTRWVSIIVVVTLVYLFFR
jgi:uncharacterized protein YoxC